MAKKESFSVSEFADFTGVSVRTLHYYDEKGIFVPKRDKKTGHRQYLKEDTIRLHQIMTLKFLGFSLEEIKEYIHSTSFDLSFIETLRLQETKLLKDKEKIDVSLETIQRTVQLIENEKEIDRDMFVSLLASMQTEKQQKEASKGIIADQAIDRIFQATNAEKMLWEKEILHFYKETRRLAGKPYDHPEVIQMIEEFYTYLLEIFNFKDLTHIFKQENVEDIDEEELQQFLNEMEKLVPTPLTKEEDQWLDQVIEEYVDSTVGKEEFDGRKS